MRGKAKNVRDAFVEEKNKGIPAKDLQKERVEEWLKENIKEVK